MKHLYEPGVADEVKRRIAAVDAQSARQWGRMTPAQMLAHCALAMRTAVGDDRPPRQLMGLLVARFARAAVLSDDPMPHDAPSARGLIVRDERMLEVERRRLLALVDRFADGGPAACTTHPHSFWGRLTPVEWATWQYKHLDHHLRQFGA